MKVKFTFANEDLKEVTKVIEVNAKCLLEYIVNKQLEKDFLKIYEGNECYYLTKVEDAD